VSTSRKLKTIMQVIRYGTDISDGLHRIKMFLDGKKIGEFKLNKRTRSWAINETVSLNKIQFPAGKHVITLLIMEGVNDVS